MSDIIAMLTLGATSNLAPHVYQARNRRSHKTGVHGMKNGTHGKKDEGKGGGGWEDGITKKWQKKGFGEHLKS